MVEEIKETPPTPGEQQDNYNILNGQASDPTPDGGPASEQP